MGLSSLECVAVFILAQEGDLISNNTTNTHSGGIRSLKLDFTQGLNSRTKSSAKLQYMMDCVINGIS